MVEFEPNLEYNNVYFMMIDAKGHSQIVASNPEDKIDKAFDEFETLVYRSVDEIQKQYRCSIAEFWGWQGDGGLCVFKDEEENRTIHTCIDSAINILSEIPHLNERWKKMNINGELHVKIALGKGSLKYKGDDKRGSIHSRDLNLVAHVEKVVPKDTIVISNEIYEISKKCQEKFYDSEIPFEGNKFFLYSLNQDKVSVLAEWTDNVSSFEGEYKLSIDSDVKFNEIGLKGIYSQRAITGEYVELLKGAKEKIYIMGVGLSGFKSDHREEDILNKCLEGIDVKFLIADPKIIINIGNKKMSIPQWRDYMTKGGDRMGHSSKLIKMIDEINIKIDESKSPNKKRINYKFYNVIPTFALFIVDSTLYCSPYFAGSPTLKSFTLKFSANSRLYTQCEEHFNRIWSDSEYSR